MLECIHVEVAYAEADRQFLRRVELRGEATVASAIEASAIERELGIDASTFTVGIWSKAATREACVREGDRIELYRPLKSDPKEARRRRAATLKR